MSKGEFKQAVGRLLIEGACSLSPLFGDATDGTSDVMVGHSNGTMDMGKGSAAGKKLYVRYASGLTGSTFLFLLQFDIFSNTSPIISTQQVLHQGRGQEGIAQRALWWAESPRLASAGRLHPFCSKCK